MQSVKLNLIPGAVLPVVNVSQYDVKRTFALAVYDGAASYDLTGKTVTIRGTKPDNHGFDYGTSDGVVSVSGNTVTISTTQQMTAVGGHVMAELRIESGTTVIGTLNFIIDVEPSALSDDTIISDTEIPVIERDFEAALAEAEADALVAEGYAKGTQDGVPVGPGSPYYHENAKHYKEEAEAAASGVLEKYPKIVADYWYIWDVETNQYVNTGVRAKGTQGDPGQGVPAGGTTGQVLRKKSDDNYDTEWANGGGGASALDDLTDVDITSPASGDGLLYDGAEWVNGAVATPTQLTAKLDITDEQVLGAWNLLILNEAVTQTFRGITWTAYADGTITAVGEVESGQTASTIEIGKISDVLDSGDTCYLSGCPNGGSDSTYFIMYSNNVDASYRCYGDNKPITIFNKTTYPNSKMYLTVMRTAGSVNLTFKPMISLKPNMPYVPPVMTNKELTDAKAALDNEIITLGKKDTYRVQFANSNPSGVIFGNLAKFNSFLLFWHINSFSSTGIMWLSWRYDDVAYIKDVVGTGSQIFTASFSGSNGIKLRTTQAAGGCQMFAIPTDTSKFYTFTQDNT